VHAISVDLFKPVYYLGNLLVVIVGHFNVVHVPSQGELLTIYHFVRDAWVVWVEFKALRPQVANELLLEE
jgi:hypothetical protein